MLVKLRSVLEFKIELEMLNEKWRLFGLCLKILSEVEI